MKMNRQDKGRFWGKESTLLRIPVMMHLSHGMYNTRMIPHVSYGLRAIRTHQRGFTDCDKCPPRYGVWTEGGRASAETGCMGTPCPSPQFCCDPGTAIKNKAY